jgi:hypothetical protein
VKRNTDISAGDAASPSPYQAMIDIEHGGLRVVDGGITELHYKLLIDPCFDI